MNKAINTLHALLSFPTTILWWIKHIHKNENFVKPLSERKKNGDVYTRQTYGNEPLSLHMYVSITRLAPSARPNLPSSSYTPLYLPRPAEPISPQRSFVRQSPSALPPHPTDHRSAPLEMKFLRTVSPISTLIRFSRRQARESTRRAREIAYEMRWTRRVCVLYGMSVRLSISL